MMNGRLWVCTERIALVNLGMTSDRSSMEKC